jgi:phosphocarrier protein
MIEREVLIANRLGLHARAAARFVNTAGRFRSRITLAQDSRRADGKSILGILLLAASRGSRLMLNVDGPDELEAADALEALVSGGFGEGAA